MKRRAVFCLAGTAALAAAVLLAITIYHSRQWVGAKFPGFFVMANRVIPSISLPGWFDVPPAALFQQQVVAVEGVPVTTADETYAAARRNPSGTPLRYTIRGAGDRPEVVTVPSRLFSTEDYLLLFGTHLLNGAAFILIGLVVFALKPRSAASLGLLASGLCTGVFVTTAVDLYGPHWFFRLHVLAESLVPATLIHLALVFPSDRLRGRRLPILAATYLPFVALGVAYELCMYSPAGYRFAHLVAMVGFDVGGVAITTSVAYDLVTSRSPLVRRRTEVVAAGVLVGLLLPTVLFAVSGMLGGSVPINGAAFTAFIFPLAIGYATVKRDLFEIDILLRRTISYAVVIVAIAVAYFGAWLALGLVVPGRSLLLESPVTLAALNLGLLFLIAPMRERVQRAVDQVFFRKDYDAEGALSNLSQVLGAVLTDDEVEAHLARVLDDTVYPARAALFESQEGLWVCRDPGLAADADAFISHATSGRMAAVARCRPCGKIWALI